MTDSNGGPRSATTRSSFDASKSCIHTTDRMPVAYGPSTKPVLTAAPVAEVSAVGQLSAAVAAASQARAQASRSGGPPAVPSSGSEVAPLGEDEAAAIASRFFAR